MDVRGIPTSLCPECGCDVLKVLVKFDHDTYEIGMYALEAECANCGTLLTAPTPIDIIGNDGNRDI